MLKLKNKGRFLCILHLLPFFHHNITLFSQNSALRHCLPFYIREGKSRQEFHRVIFVLEAKGKGLMPKGEHETKGTDLERTVVSDNSKSLNLALT